MKQQAQEANMNSWLDFYSLPKKKIHLHTKEISAVLKKGPILGDVKVPVTFMLNHQS